MEDVPARTLPESPSITMIAQAALEGKVEWQVSVRKTAVRLSVAICGDLTRGDYIGVEACRLNKREAIRNGNGQQVKE